MYYLRILKLLCTFVIELRNMFNQLNFQAMQDQYCVKLIFNRL